MSELGARLIAFHFDGAYGEPSGPHPYSVVVDANKVARADLAPRFIRFLEVVSASLSAKAGLTTVELNFQDGHFEYAWVKRRLRVAEITDLQEAFEEDFDAFLGEARTSD
jgi:hypothetical protein